MTKGLLREPLFLVRQKRSPNHGIRPRESEFFGLHSTQDEYAIRIAVSLAFAVLAASCASQGGTEGRPSGLTVSCETWHSNPRRCFCASRDGLKDVLGPRQEPY